MVVPFRRRLASDHLPCARAPALPSLGRLERPAGPRHALAAPAIHLDIAATTLPLIVCLPTELLERPASRGKPVVPISMAASSVDSSAISVAVGDAAEGWPANRRPLIAALAEP